MAAHGRSAPELIRPISAPNVVVLGQSAPSAGLFLPQHPIGLSISYTATNSSTEPIAINLLLRFLTFTYSELIDKHDSHIFHSIAYTDHCLQSTSPAPRKTQSFNESQA